MNMELFNTSVVILQQQYYNGIGMIQNTKIIQNML